MQLCKNGTHWSQVWVDSGVNRCFYQSVSSVGLCAFVIICGLMQCGVFSKYAYHLDTRQSQNFCIYIFQILLTTVLMCETIVHMILYNIYMKEKVLYGYEVLETCFLLMAFVVSLWLLTMERKSMLPSTSRRGQGIVLLGFWSLFFIKESLLFVSWNNPTYWWKLTSQEDNVELVLFVLRYACSVTLLILGFTVKRSSYMPFSDEDGEPSANSSTWSNVFKKLRMMMPYVWPKGNVVLQITVIICVIILAAGRAVNVLIPIYSKKIVDSLTYSQGSTADLEYRWDYIMIFVVITYLRGGGAGNAGMLNGIRSLLWIKVQQFTTRSIQVKLFSHLHGLSLHWHLSRKTGEVLRVVDRGTNSINNLLSYIVFQILPTIVDIVIAIVYFVTFFNYLFGLIVFTSMAAYLAITFIITEWRTKFRREQNLKDNAANARAVDSLLNFETVKYYGASDYERDRYLDAILEYQSAEWKASASLSLLNAAQNTVSTIGLAAGCLLCAWAVTNGINDLHLTVGDYVLLGTYLTQLYGPLNWLGTYYRMIQQSFIDMENMFDLFGQDMEIQDMLDAKDINIKGGEIQFKSVDFSYEPSKQILKNVSFTVPAGQTLALVGHTGSGKSTIVKLMFRFYNVNSGSIWIDGQDISMVTQKSLRKIIGVVPQDTVLFNNNIRYNIHYGKIGSSDSEVEDAARAAEIHDRILTFPKKYETVVGERGLKLSGGEKQRVAIARTLLKAPAIVLLDEATSALDTKTERHIQSSLARVCENRTTIIVAHRLSTIIHSHQIIVLNEGQIVESGTHEELLAHDGYYAEMWHQQLVKQEIQDKTEDSPESVSDGNGI